MQEQATSPFFSPRTVRISLIMALGTLLVIGGLLQVVGHHPTTPATRSTTAGCGGVTATHSPAVQHDLLAEYTLPHAHSDLMSPVVDAQGHLWFGEMGTNQLGKFDPPTETISEWTPPQGQGGIMGMTTDAQGQVWFAEEVANYIGRFTPATCQFRIYPLPATGGQAASPVAVAFAPDGRLWFTQFGNSAIGVLDPRTGLLHTYSLPQVASQSALPYGITVDRTGMVWFTELWGNAIGRLNPTTGAIQVFPLATATAQPDTITRGPDGRLWFGEMASGNIGVIDPTTLAVTEIAPPPTYGHVGEIYDMQERPDGVVWLTSAGTNALLSYDPQTTQWQRVDLPTAASVPYGIALAPDGKLWFTEAADQANRLGVYTSG